MREIDPSYVYQSTMYSTPNRVQSVAPTAASRDLPAATVLQGELLRQPRAATAATPYLETVYRHQAYEPVTTTMSLQEKRGVNAYLQQQQRQGKGEYIDDFA